MGGHRLEHVREQHPVDQEARGAGNRHRQLVQRFAEAGQALLGLRGHALVLDDLHQRHLRHGIEVVQPGEPSRALQVRGQFDYRDR